MDRGLDGAELLVATDELYLFAAELGEDCEVTEDVEDMGWPKHSGDQDLLAGELRFAELSFDFGEGNGAGVLPFEVMAGQGRDGAGAGPLEAGRDEDLNTTKEGFAAFVRVDDAEGFAAIRIALELLDGLVEGVGKGGPLAFDDDEGDAVHEEDEVGEDVLAVLAAGAVDAKLVDDAKSVVFGMIPIEVVNGLIAALIPIFEAIDDGAAEELGGRGFVGFDEIVVRDLGESVEGLGEPVGIEPLLAGGVAVDTAERGFKVGAEHDFAKALAVGDAGAIDVATGELPAEADELVDERSFGFDEFFARHRRLGS